MTVGETRLTGIGSWFFRVIITLSRSPVIDRLATLAPRIPLLSLRTPRDLSCVAI